MSVGAEVFAGAISAGSTILANDNGLQSGRVFSHWSQYCLLTGALLATVSAVALAVIAAYPAAIVLGVLAVIDLVGVYYLKKFVPQQELEGDILLIQQRTRKLAAENSRLNSENTRLSDAETRLQQQLREGDERRKAIDAQAAKDMSALNETVTGLNQALDKEKATLAHVTAENLKYLAAEKATTEQARKTTEAFKAALSTFEKLNKTFEENNEEVSKLSAGSTQLNGILKDLSTNTADNTKLMAQLTVAIGILSQRFEESVKVNVDTNKEYDELQRENDELKESVAKFETNAKNVGTAADSIKKMNAVGADVAAVGNQVISEEQAVNKQVRDLNASLKALLAQDDEPDPSKPKDQT